MLRMQKPGSILQACACTRSWAGLICRHSDVQIAEQAFQRTKLLKWLLTRVRPREFDSNKQYASELLSILLQSSAANQQALVDADGIELLLQVCRAACMQQQ